MSKTDKTALAAGAAAIRKAESDTKGKLDGTLGAVVKEITKLHSEILDAAKTSLSKAIEIGKLLHRVRASRKGKWLAWVKDNCPFSQPTAWRYMSCFDRRHELKLFRVNNLDEAYALLLPPKKARPAQQAEIESQSNGEAVASEPEPEEQSQPQRRNKSQKQIMKELQKIGEIEQEAEKKANVQLSEIITTLSGKVRAQWLEFPDYLAAHGKALVELSERLRLNTPR